MRRVIGIGVTAVGILSSSVSLAQEFARPGQVVIGAERLTGVFSDHFKVEQPDTQQDANGNTVSVTRATSYNTTSIGLLGMSSGVSLGSIAYPASTPRLAADVFVIQGLSVGGSFMYMNRSGTDKTEYSPDPEQQTHEDDQATQSILLFSPRVGYALPLSEAFAIWPRAGITYTNYRITTKNTQGNGTTEETKTSVDFTDVSLEVMLAALPVPHFAILFGPYFDIPLGGGRKVTVNGTEQPTPNLDLSYLSFGVSAGIGGYF